jgi:hypothetical protein
MCFCYSLRVMNVRWFTTKAVFLLLGLAVYSANTFPQRRYDVAPESLRRLRFVKSTVLSDFDADGLIDEARVAGSGLRRRVEILLSHAGKLVLLRFDSDGYDHGSLFAQDVDNDGATDLIWSDLLHADDVVVWLGDGAGEFARVPSCAYSDGFTLGDTNVAGPDGSSHETGDSETLFPLDQILAPKSFDRVPTELPRQRLNRVALRSPALREPTGRGPPLLLS